MSQLFKVTIVSYILYIIMTGVAGNLTRDPWFTRQVVYPLHHCGSYNYFIYSVYHNDVFFHISPVENQNDLELDFKVFFFIDSCC